jgi:hypothetical protein
MEAKILHKVEVISTGLTHKTKETRFLALILRMKSAISRSETGFGA